MAYFYTKLGYLHLGHMLIWRQIKGFIYATKYPVHSICFESAAKHLSYTYAAQVLPKALSLAKFSS